MLHGSIRGFRATYRLFLNGLDPGGSWFPRYLQTAKINIAQESLCEAISERFRADTMTCVGTASGYVSACLVGDMRGHSVRLRVSLLGRGHAWAQRQATCQLAW